MKILLCFFTSPRKSSSVTLSVWASNFS